MSLQRRRHRGRNAVLIVEGHMQPAGAAVVTHFHLGHTFGNLGYAEQRIPILAHEKVTSFGYSPAALGKPNPRQTKGRKSWKTTFPGQPVIRRPLSLVNSPTRSWCASYIVVR